ncbi:Pyruvate kinase [Rubripirellula amarantea]|uniref:Pyruvate kinase n=1 Tax=Rubripirellula amarantea TaxID=2527999 RepID=A0A5C5WUF8_9BACT|nr:pyruvate kinase [Rubripirellula amarantea]TWT54367.1 Pyruvate kinase [Rubripirellula amarantea]
MPNLSAHYRHTKIIATLGPATSSDEKLIELIQAGVDVVRLNMAHGSPEWVIEIVATIRRISNQINRQVAVMMDVKGPEIRTGLVEHPIELKKGDQLMLVTKNAQSMEGSSIPVVDVNYEGFPDAVEIGATVLVDSGLMRWKVVSKTDSSVTCEVRTNGTLSSRRHINLPGVHVDLPALTEKDQVDLRAGVEAGIDFVALSFVRRAEDIHQLRRFLAAEDSDARIIAKIEEQAGVRNMAEIIKASDAVMVARGDLGIEIDLPKLPLVQTQLVKACQAEGKPVIIATHLLESMIESPIPTRAEISDVCNAVREQADAVMLSGETTTGDYPIESVDTLVSIIQEIEPSVSAELNDDIELHEPKSKMLRAAAMLAQDLASEDGKQSGIVVFTRSGFLAYVLGALRPRGVPIFAFTDVESTFRQTLLPWGVEPFLINFSDDPEKTIADAMNTLRQKGWVSSGTWLVVITNALAHQEVIDTMQLRRV